MANRSGPNLRTLCSAEKLRRHLPRPLTPLEAAKLEEWNQLAANQHESGVKHPRHPVFPFVGVAPERDWANDHFYIDLISELSARQIFYAFAMAASNRNSPLACRKIMDHWLRPSDKKLSYMGTDIHEEKNYDTLMDLIGYLETLLAYPEEDDREVTRETLVEELKQEMKSKTPDDSKIDRLLKVLKSGVLDGEPSSSKKESFEEFERELNAFSQRTTSDD